MSTNTQVPQMHSTPPERFAALEGARPWLQQIMLLTARNEPEWAFYVLRAVLHTLRDQLTHDEAMRLGSRLPAILRALYREDWHLQDVKKANQADFLAGVAGQCPGLSSKSLERAVWAVLTTLSRHISPDELRIVRNQLPTPMRALWNTAA